MRLWCVVAVVMAAAGGAESWLEGFGDSLHADLADLLQEAAVEYHEPVINTTYVASVEFDMRAMGPLYNATGAVIDFVAKKQAYPEGRLRRIAPFLIPYMVAEMRLRLRCPYTTQWYDLSRK